MVLSLEKENITKKDRSVLADNFCSTRLLLQGQSCCMPLGLPIRAKRVPRWRRSRHHFVWRHIQLSPADDRNEHFVIFFFFLFFPIYCTAFFSGWYFSNTFWNNLLPGRLVPFHWLRHLLFSVGSCTAFRDEWYSRWKRRATLWLHAWPSLLKHGRKRRNWSTSGRDKERKRWGGGDAACPCGRMHTGVCVCVCVCVCVSEKDLDERLCVRARARARASQWKESSRQNCNHNKRYQWYFKESAASTMQRKIQHEKAASSFFLSVNHCHPYWKKERSSLLNLHMFQSTCFRT